MKRICVFLIFIITFSFIPTGLNTSSVYAQSETSTYAKALDNCVLYKSQSLENELDNIYFVVPETYFVVLLEKLTERCYKVQYDKYIGYIDSSTIIVATFIPIVKTLQNIKCDIKETVGTQIWNKPTANGNVLTTIPAGTCEINYISYIYGEIPIGGESNIWYYISYTPYSNSTNVYEGYVYSENVTNLTEIVSNVEANPESLNQDNNVNKDTLSISSTLKTVIIALISVPIILLISIILYKIIKKITENTNKVRNENNSFYKENGNIIHGSNLNFYDNDHIDNNHGYGLKNQINKMRDTTFVKKIDSRKQSLNNKYPEFPTYNSEDDLL